jgi:hypothetical protein
MRCRRVSDGEDAELPRPLGDLQHSALIGLLVGSLQAGESHPATRSGYIHVRHVPALHRVDGVTSTLSGLPPRGREPGRLAQGRGRRLSAPDP